MAILIEDLETEQLIRTLAERTSESIAEAVRQAVRQRLERVLIEDEIAVRKHKIDALIARANAIPTVDDRTPDDIIGYKFGYFK